MAEFNSYQNYDESTSPFQSIVFGSNTPILEVELNEMQIMQAHKIRTLCKDFLGDCVSPSTTITLNNKVLTLNGSMLVQGYIIKLENVTVNNIVDGDVYVDVTVSTLTKDSTVKKHGYTGGTNITNTMMDNRYNIETSRRKSLSFSFTQTSSATTSKIGTVVNGVFIKSVFKNNQEYFARRIGSLLTLKNTYKGGFDLEIQGKSVQNGTPTPDVPVPIQSVGDTGSLVLRTSNKNLLAPSVLGDSRTSNGLTFTRNTDGSWTVNGTNTAVYTGIIGRITLPKGTYTVSGGKIASGEVYCQLKYTENGTTYFITNGPFTLKETTECFASVQIGNFISTVTNYTIYPQIEVGTVATAYEPYKGTQITIPLNEPLRGIDNVSDRIIKKGGIWGVERNLARLVFDGSSDEYWSTNSSIYGELTARFDSTDLKNGLDSDGIRLLSNKLRATDGRNLSDAEHIRGGSLGYPNALIVYVNKTRLSTIDVAGFRTWLASNPITVIYQLATPTWTPFPKNIQDQLNYYLNTYEDTTNIYTQDALNPNLVVDYGMSDVSALSILNKNKMDSGFTVDEDITLTASKWIGTTAPYTYVLDYSSIYDVEIMTTSSTTLEQLKALERARIISNSDGNTIIAWGTKPTIDIPLKAKIRLKSL